MLKSCKRLKYVKFIVLIVKKNQPYTSEVHCIIYKKNPTKNQNKHIKVPRLIIVMYLTIQVHI